MIIKTKDLQDVCKKVLSAIDTSISDSITEVVELKSLEDSLTISITNNEYYVSSIIKTTSVENLLATVNAKIFLGLVSKITTENIELSVVDNKVLVVKGNGTYKLPFVFKNDELVRVSPITIENPTCEFDLNSDVLKSINKYNSKEFLKSGLRKSTQKMYYIDQEGAITFTVGACVNKFTLPKDIKFVVIEKFAKLFSLFDSEKVNFSFGYNVGVNSLPSAVFELSNATTKFVAIIGDNDYLLKSIPTRAIRARANELYPYSVVIEKSTLLEALDRISLFSQQDVYVSYTHLYFDNDGLTIYDTKKTNNEEIAYASSVELDEPWEYTCLVDSNDLKIALETCTSQYLTLNFGNGQAINLVYDNVVNIMPECSSDE